LLYVTATFDGDDFISRIVESNAAAERTRETAAQLRSPSKRCGAAAQLRWVRGRFAVARGNYCCAWSEGRRVLLNRRPIQLSWLACGKG